MKVFTLFFSKNDQYRHSTKSIEMINIIIFGWFTYVMSDITRGHLRSFSDYGPRATLHEFFQCGGDVAKKGAVYSLWYGSIKPQKDWKESLLEEKSSSGSRSVSYFSRVEKKTEGEASKAKSMAVLEESHNRPEDQSFIVLY